MHLVYLFSIMFLINVKLSDLIEKKIKFILSEFQISDT